MLVLSSPFFRVNGTVPFLVLYKKNSERASFQMKSVYRYFCLSLGPFFLKIPVLSVRPSLFSVQGCNVFPSHHCFPLFWRGGSLLLKFPLRTFLSLPLKYRMRPSSQ